MIETRPATQPSSRALVAIGALVTAVVIAAIAGGCLAGRVIAHADAHGVPVPVGPYAIGQDVPTSFGFVAVEHAETLKGLTAGQLGGATHGIGGFVGRDRALVQAAITLTNTTDEPLAYSPRQFGIVARSRKGNRSRRIPLAHASVRDGELQPDAAIDARLSFVVPRDGSRLEVQFDDRGRREPIRILLDNRSGRVTAKDRAALAEGHGTAAGSGHDHDDHEH